MGNVISLDPLIKRVCDAVFDFGWEFGVRHAAYVYYLPDSLESMENSLGELKAIRAQLIRKIIYKHGYGKQTDEIVEWWIKRMDKQIKIGDQLKIEGTRHADSLCLAGICSTHYFSTSQFGGQVEKCVKELNSLKTVGEKFKEEDLVVIAAYLGAKMPSDSVGLARMTSDRHVDSLCLAGICSMCHFSTTSVLGVQVETSVEELRIDGEGFTDEDLVVKAAIERGQRAVQMPCDSLGLAKMTGDSVGLETKLDEVLTYLNQENVGIVGVYGQGGVGKTTLLKEISRSENFLVVWIDVPEDVNLESIQEAIVGKIGLPDELKVSCMEVKASYIFKALQQKKIILLLDDIRKAINLSKIGIPPSHSLNDSKVVFTTRPEHCCRRMEPQPGWSTSIEALGEEQAWQLFVMNVGEDIYNHSQILQLAKRVAKKCGGLPLALTIIGQAMSGERKPKVWEHTLKTFETPSLQQEANEDIMTELFSILRYSYDSLPNETYKSCFLYCALFPEASEIDKDNLIKCWTFGVFSTDSDEDDLDPHYEAYCILNVLVSSCLLEDGKEWVKMHDIVRSMALWIGKEDTLVMSGMEREEAPSITMWKKMKRVSIMWSGIKQLTQVPECPHLLSLFLDHNQQLKEICSGFFESMGMLTVLNLSYTGIKELPESMSRLVLLKYLNLSRTKITELSVVLTKLKALTYLNVNGVQNLRLCRKNQILGHLLSLQDLGMMCKYYYYEEGEEEVGGISSEGETDEILLEELQVLDNLKVLDISLTSFSGLMKLFNNRRLLKFTQLLNLINFKSLEPIDISLLAETKHLDTFSIIFCDFKELKNSQESILKSSTSSILTQMIWFVSIRAFNVYGCKYLEDITCVASMPNLRRLSVLHCGKLREIISNEKIGNDEEVYQIFSNLAILKLENLPVLKSIYPSTTLSLRFLYDLIVEDCPQLKELPLDPNNGVLGCSQITLYAEQKWWDAVEWEDDAAKDSLLPRSGAEPP